MDKFVKTVTKSEVNKVVDGYGPQCIFMTVIPFRDGCSIELVIGACAEHMCASSLSKSGVKELISLLTEIHEAMED